MEVPVVEIGDVPVGVRHPFMIMGMRVPRRRREARVRVVVVAVVVAMAVNMLQRFVGVSVLVPVEEEQSDT